MESQEANYIISNFPRLMTELEINANKHYLFSAKLGEPNDYDDDSSYKRRKEFFKKRNGITENPDVLKLLENGYNEFVLRAAKRIKKESSKQYTITRCSKCNFIARTPYAKQCRKCGNNWHDKIAGEFQFEDTFKLTNKPYLWIIGEVVKGEVRIGNLLDLTNFQLNIIAEIKQIEFTLKRTNNISKEYPTLGIDVSFEEEELIKKYLSKSAKTIMILKEI